MAEQVKNTGDVRVARAEAMSFEDARAWRNERELYELQECRVILHSKVEKSSRNPEYFAEVKTATVEWCRRQSRLRQQRQKRRREERAKNNPEPPCEYCGEVHMVRESYCANHPSPFGHRRDDLA